ncbi:uncharacterized protein EV154DRAFT_486598 [Mucor mucedo]|uniref:uncharacterized protein n=1 Tax=Mucor mucedo TaxID=29922 RepID=UPI00221FBC48|nr:uncharacterized protein EV154DRAFT_486598 [Mucor mucedo]KAI7875925.1 hypothetical protein EV154DRAFT_486598 [Mucor mucedo]
MYHRKSRIRDSPRIGTCDCLPHLEDFQRSLGVHVFLVDNIVIMLRSKAEWSITVNGFLFSTIVWLMRWLPVFCHTFKLTSIRNVTTYLGYKMAEEMLGVRQNSYNRFTKRFFHAKLRSLKNYSIRWPSTRDECQDIIAGFAIPSRGNGCIRLKECIRAIGGELIVAQKPSAFGNTCLDLQNFCSRIQLLILLEVRDSAYPIIRHCLTSYRRTRDITLAQTKYNTVHSSTRFPTENYFGLFVAKWRFLYRNLDVLDLKELPR